MNEEQIVKRYEPMLNKLVWRFMVRCPAGRAIRKDLLQEARMAFLEHVRTHGEDEYMRCYRTIFNALYEAVRREYIVHVPHGVFKRETEKGKEVMPFSEIVQGLALEEGYEQVEIITDIMQTARDEQERRLVRLKLVGLNNRDAGRVLGMNDVQVTRNLQRMRARLG